MGKPKKVTACKQAHTGFTLLVFKHTKPEETSGQTSCMQGAQVLVTDITKSLHHTGSGSVYGWGMDFCKEKKHLSINAAGSNSIQVRAKLQNS